MARSREDILKDLADGVLTMDADLAVSVAKEAVESELYHREAVGLSR